MFISDDKRLIDIQGEFNAKFPNLKIVFYSKHHEEGKGSPKQTMLDSELTVGEVRTIHNMGDLSINGHLKVATLESNFYEKYGLNVQVWRKSGSSWLQTTTTDSWTLTEQNNRGQSSNDPSPLIQENRS